MNDPQRATDTEMIQRLNTLTEQRNAALDECVLRAGRMAAMQEQLNAALSELLKLQVKPEAKAKK